jgi:hypothetical protein
MQPIYKLDQWTERQKEKELGQETEKQKEGSRKVGNVGR